MKPEIDYHKNFVNFKKRTETNYIVVHCAATQNKPEYTWKTIDAMHRQNGWLCIGYHFVILTDGTIQNGRDLDAVGSHVKGYNSESVGICLIGGIDSKGKSVDNFTKEQKDSLRELIAWLKSDHYPDAKLQGHRDFPDDKKDCPCFDVNQWWVGEQTAFYEVQPTDTLWSIARSHGMSLASLMILNPDIDDEDIFYAGQKVRVKL